jgi:hypothetical protein
MKTVIAYLLSDTRAAAAEARARHPGARVFMRAVHAWDGVIELDVDGKPVTAIEGPTAICLAYAQAGMTEVHDLTPPAPPAGDTDTKPPAGDSGTTPPPAPSGNAEGGAIPPKPGKKA